MIHWILEKTLIHPAWISEWNQQFEQWNFVRQISSYFFFAPAQTLCRLVLCVRQSPLQVYKNILMDFPSSIYRSAYLGRHKHGVFFFHSPPTVWIKPRPDFSASEWVDLFQQPEAPAHLRDWAQTGEDEHCVSLSLSKVCECTSKLFSRLRISLLVHTV